MPQIVLFLAAVAVVSYLIPIVIFLVRRTRPAPSEQPARERVARSPSARAHAGNAALDRMVELVDEPSQRKPDPPSHSDKVVNLR
ncbi:MAG TPA: hypothetical protein VG757_01695 [Devosia sp.]|nr:hypothetical protein [Devosia sp.]